MNYQQIKAIEKKNKERLLKVNPALTEESGIYFLTREDEDGIKYAYIGQAKHILTRLAQHLVGYQHIDISLKKHGLISNDNMLGWNVNFILFPEDELDEKEKYYIQKYAKSGYQLRNKTAGSQGKGKRKIDDFRPSKTYRDGIDQGMKNASKIVSQLLTKHLVITTKDNPPTANQQRAMDKFNDFISLSQTKDKEGD